MQFLKGNDRVLLGPPAYYQLRYHQGQTDNQNAAEVHQYEGAAPVHARDIGKLPDIPQPDRRAGGRQDET